MFWFPGTLILYDVETGRQLRIDTDQGDSEVLLVDGANVFYRADRRLFRAVIGPAGLERVTLVASDPAIGNAHVAFIPHPITN